MHNLQPFVVDTLAYTDINRAQVCNTTVLWGYGATMWRSWLRHCATSWKVAGSIPDGANGIFHLLNPSGRTMALGFTQPLTEISTRNISWGVKAAGA